MDNPAAGRVRAGMALRGMSQKTLALHCGVSTQMINAVLTGKKPISVDLAIDIEHALNGWVPSAHTLLCEQVEWRLTRAREERARLEGEWENA